MRILVAEDHALVRTGISLLLSPETDLEVVGQTGYGMEVERLVNDLQPDLVLLDLALPDCSGIEVTARIRRHNKKVKILIITGNIHPGSVSRAFSAGADGYVLKHEDGAELLDAIRALERGRRYVSRAINKSYGLDSRRVLNELTPDITPREQQIMRMIAHGMSTTEIADTLHISVLTARKHRQNLMLKLDLHKTAEITSYAMRSGFIVHPAPTAPNQNGIGDPYRQPKPGYSSDRR